MENEVRGAQDMSPLPAGSLVLLGFPGSSADKESICNTGEPSSIPESGSYPGEGIGYPLQYSWASLVTQMVKNPPAIRETWVRSLGWEDPLEESMATHSSIREGNGNPVFLPGKSHGWRSLTTVHGVAKSRIKLSD